MPIPDDSATLRDPDERQRLRIARAIAIERYALMEHTLCTLFARLLATPDDRAAIVFFKIANFRSRNTIISELLEKQFNDEYDIYWHGVSSGHENKKPGLFKFIRKLDGTRNEIVHWTAISALSVTPDGHTKREYLASPYTVHVRGRESQLTSYALADFSELAQFVQRSIFMFSFMTMNIGGTTIPDDQRGAWRQIFRQPVVYPPPDSHPLSPNYKEPQTPPQPSQE